MRINHNHMAMFAARQLTASQTELQKSLEKLSSGLRIYRAADDAAGLAISEKMRGQIRGLRMARKNAQDAISLIQTAEGALQTSHAILQRMRELAVQAANDTYTDADRAAIQREVDQLAQELTRIAHGTTFNTRVLLDGSIQPNASGELIFQIGPNAGHQFSLSIRAMDAISLGVGRLSSDAPTNPFYAWGIIEGSIALEFITIGKEPGTAIQDKAVITIVFKETDAGTGLPVVTLSDGNVTEDILVDDLTAVTSTVSKFTVKSGSFANLTVYTSDIYQLNGSIKIVVIPLAPEPVADTLQGIDVSTRQSANDAIAVIQQAIDTVSAERAKLGAAQNRLEHTIANLGISAENLQAAESRIRDADMAQEMMRLVKHQILQQTSMAMLAQANVAPQSILQLLR